MNSIKLNTQPLKGILDFSPLLLEKYNTVKLIIDHVAQQNRYLEYDVPILESWETFSVKTATEILEEQSYYFIDRGGRKVILRPEITPSLARLIAKEIKQLPQPVRWYTVGRCYRYERPQKGRLREFRQLNFDILGGKSYIYDLEILRIVKHLMEAFSIPPEEYTIKYNHRGLVNMWLKNQGFDIEQTKKFFSLADKKNKLSPNDFEKQIQEQFPTPKLREIAKKYFCFTQLQNLFPYKENLLPEERDLFDDIIKLENTLTLLNPTYFEGKAVFSPEVVRGFDYYTGLVFEVFAEKGDIRRSLFGGGRYDNLIGNYLNQNISGIGFGMGLDIFILFLESNGNLPKTTNKMPSYYIAPLDESGFVYSIEIGKELICQGVQIENAPAQKISKHFRRVNSFTEENSFTGMIIVGDTECSTRTFTWKNLHTGKQETLPFTSIKNLPRGRN